MTAGPLGALMKLGGGGAGGLANLQLKLKFNLKRQVDDSLRKIELKQSLHEKVLHLKSVPFDGFNQETLHNVVEVLKPHMLDRLRTKNT